MEQPASLSIGELRSCLVPAKFGECQGGYSLIRNTSAEQYMFEEDHIYISSRVFSAGTAMPNWPCGSVEEARSLVVHAVELSFPAGDPSGWEKGSRAAIIGAGDRRQETAWCQLTLICALSCPICVIGKGKASLLRAVTFFFIRRCLNCRWLASLNIALSKILGWNWAYELCCIGKCSLLFMKLKWSQQRYSRMLWDRRKCRLSWFKLFCSAGCRCTYMTFQCDHHFFPQ